MNRSLLFIILLCVNCGVSCRSAQAEDDDLPQAPSAYSVETTASEQTLPHSYQPAMPVTTLTWGMKLNYYLRSTGSFRNFLEAGLVAGIPNLPSAPSQRQPHGNCSATLFFLSLFIRTRAMLPLI